MTRAQKRWKRENRDAKKTTWKCTNCGDRHQKGFRCPMPRRDAPVLDPMSSAMATIFAAAMARSPR